MSVSVALQKLLYDALRADRGMRDLVAGRVYDRVPKEPEFPYVSFGSYDFVPDEADCIYAGEHTQQLDFWSRAAGRVEARRLVDAARHIIKEIDDVDMGEYSLAGLRVVLARVFGDPDGLTSHGVLQVTATIEEPE